MSQNALHGGVEWKAKLGTRHGEEVLLGRAWPLFAAWWSVLSDYGAYELVANR
ncbi:MAG: hypothetical protein LBD34_04100 [Puniceicoccales bacterium]|jgi:hypothetical protein|nr:hypothetical protein [Puniceicoccales bacterium]